ncbi:MAG: ImmA/IrrE family metallo-endopeptidase [Clostridiales bacterium]|nr:ImmA/IrrE family metallo-endopeptidase [Clostridiales bacterium]
MDMWIDKTDIEDRALKVRQEHNIQTYGIKDIFSMIDQRGIDLIRYPFGKDELLGFSTIFEGRKIIVSNSSEILSREIFTIAHELGHIIFDFEDENHNVKIDIDIDEDTEDIAEKRAFYFANCLLMPEEQMIKFTKYILKKKYKDINALDIVRIQLEFQVSYAAVVKRFYDLGLINFNHKNELFNKRNCITSKSLFRMLEADEKLLKPSDIIKVPSRYYEYVISNYDNGYIPFSSLQKTLALIGIDADIFRKEEKKEELLDIDDIFEEFE